MLYRYMLYAMLVIIGQLINNKVIYLLFLILIYNEFRKEKKINHQFLLSSLIYSLVVPDNYLPELVFIIYFIFVYLIPVIQRKKVKIQNKSYYLVFILLLFHGMLTTIINTVPVINVFFAIISFLPFVIFLFTIQYKKDISDCDVGSYLDQVLFIQTIATLVNFIKLRGIIYDDWSVGTFGAGQQTQIFIVMCYCAIYYFSYYRTNFSDKKFILRIFLTTIIALSTNCWGMLGMLMFGICIGYIITLNGRKLLLALIIVCFIPFAIPIVYSFLPENVVYVVTVALNDEEYLSYRFHKLDIYKETFVEIPMKDMKYLLFGNGIGNYSSRAALICTGNYVDFYNKIHLPSISDYTQEYLMDYIELAYRYGETDFGSVVGRPYSSIISLMGECGYIGCIQFLILLTLLLCNKSAYMKLLVIVWLSFCLLENYFEYSKVIVLMYICVKSMDLKGISFPR